MLKESSPAEDTPTELTQDTASRYERCSLVGQDQKRQEGM